MAEYLGKNGSDAIFQGLTRFCIIIRRFHDKLISAIYTAQTAGKITELQASQAVAFVEGINATCAIFEAVAANSGVRPS